MRVEVDSDLRAFAERVLPWLAREPFRHNVLCTLIEAQLRVEPDPAALWARIVDDQGELAAVAVWAPPRGLLLSRMTVDLATALADDLASRPEVELPGVDGLGPEVSAFADRYAARTGLAIVPGMATTAYRLGTLVPPDGVAGRLREATVDDRPLVVRWVNQFSAEAVPGQSPSDPGPQIDARLAYGGLL